MSSIVSTTLTKYFELIYKIEEVNNEIEELLDVDDFTDNYKKLLLQQIKQNNKFMKKLQKRWTK